MLTVAEIMQLHDAGISDDLIEKMMQPAPAPVPVPAPPAPAEQELPPDDAPSAADILNSVLNS